MPDKQQKPPLSEAKRFRKRYILLPLLGVFLLTQYLNHTGFCYADMKYPNEREIVDRYLFGGKEKTMSFEEKVAYVKEHYDGADYLGSFVYEGVMKRDQFAPYGERFLIALFDFNNPTVYGHFIGKIFLQGANYRGSEEKKYKVLRTDKPPYLAYKVSTNACGEGYWNLSKGYIDEERYKERVLLNKKYWEHWQAGTLDTEYEAWRAAYYHHKENKGEKQ